MQNTHTVKPVRTSVHINDNDKQLCNYACQSQMHRVRNGRPKRLTRITLPQCDSNNYNNNNNHNDNTPWQQLGLFVFLRAGVQPTLDPSAETFISVQCASPGQGGELVGVCNVCARCVGWKEQQVWAACQVFLNAPHLGVAYCLANPRLALIQCQPRQALLQCLAIWLTLLQCIARGLSHICLLWLSRQRGWHHDAANQGISNGHSL